MTKLLKITIIIFALSSSIFSRRIITLAPAITEIVFVLGKGSQIVGNTKFCDFPRESQKITKVGGLLDLNLEMSIKLNPDLIICYPEHHQKVKILKGKVKILVVQHKVLSDIYNSIDSISKELQIPERGKNLVEKIKSILKTIQAKTKKMVKLKTLLIAGRNPDQLNNIFIIGKKDFLNELLEIAGGVNAYTGDIPYPNIGIESVVKMNPDFIIELSTYNPNLKKEKMIKLWQTFNLIRAVQNNHIVFIEENFWLRPGPRVGEIAKKLYYLFTGNDTNK